MSLTVLQLLPDLEVGGVERGTIEIADALVSKGHRALVVSAPGRLVDELKRNGGEHTSLPIGKKSLLTLGLVKPLRELIVRERVDIVHARSRLPAWIGRRAVMGIPFTQRPKWVTTVHGPYTVNRYSRIMVSGDRIIAISEFIKRYVLDNYPHVEAERISVVHRGVNEKVYNANFSPTPDWLANIYAELKISTEVKCLVFPGRLTRWKGQLDFIEVIDRLKQLGLPVCGLIAGGQSDKHSNFEAELRREVTRRGLLDQIKFLGPRGDLRELLSIADLSFSLTNKPEAFGRTTLEALALGTPVMGYEHGGTGEILRQLFPAGEVSTGNIPLVVERARLFLTARPEVPPTNTMTLRQMQEKTLSIYNQLAKS